MVLKLSDDLWTYARVLDLYLRHLQNTDERVIPELTELPMTVLTVFQKNSHFLSTVNHVTILPDAFGK